MASQAGTQTQLRPGVSQPRAPSSRPKPKPTYGDGAFGWIEQLAAIVIMTGQTIVATVTPPYNYWGETVEQTYLVIKRAFIPCMFCTFVFAWGAPGLSGGSVVATLATTDRLGSFAVMASFRELAPWINGMCVGGIAGTAICSDLGARKIRDELDALSVLGTDLIKTLIVPRFIALGVMTVIFNYWNCFLSVLGQLLCDIMVWHESAAGYMATFASNFTIAELGFNFIKVLTIGFIVAVVSCYKGLNAKGGAAGVGRAVNQAVVTSFVLIYVYNFLINSLMLGAFPVTQELR